MAYGLLRPTRSHAHSCVLPRLPGLTESVRVRFLLLQSTGSSIHWGHLRRERRSGQAVGIMQPNAQERRMMRRFDMRLPALVRLEGSSEVQTETQNVSARGVFFYLDRPVEAGTKLEVTLTFPPHITLTDAVRVRFTAHVIRVENPLPSARVGIAAMIENYEFLRSNGSPDFMSALQDEWKNTN